MRSVSIRTFVRHPPSCFNFYNSTNLGICHRKISTYCTSPVKVRSSSTRRDQLPNSDPKPAPVQHIPRNTSSRQSSSWILTPPKLRCSEQFTSPQTLNPSALGDRENTSRSAAIATEPALTPLQGTGNGSSRQPHTMSATFSIQPMGRFAGQSQPVKRPKEFACFSYDENHEFRLDDSSIKYYYTPQIGVDLSKGFNTFQKLDDSKDEHLDSLLKTIMAHEKETGKKIDANVVTWRGMMTKIMIALFEQQDGFEMNATLYQDCIFIEEHNEYKMKSRAKENHRGPRRGPPLEVMQYWGYKFETLSTLPNTWAETSREYIENRENQIVNNKEQYCSVVRTGIGKTVLCLGGEVDAIWDSKPQPGQPINWVELKTSAEIRSAHDMDNFHRKLMKFWVQSFLLGVPKIIVGFRTRDGILVDVNEMETQNIPYTVNSRPGAKWNADMCVNFAGEFLEFLQTTINDEGVWRIRRLPASPTIDVFRVEETGHGNIIPDEFKNWRIKLSLGPGPDP